MSSERNFGRGVLGMPLETRTEMTPAQCDTYEFITELLGYREHKRRLTRNLSRTKVLLDVRVKLGTHNMRLVIEPDGYFHRPGSPPRSNWIAHP